MKNGKLLNLSANRKKTPQSGEWGSYAMLAVALSLALTGEAYASPMADVLCQIVDWFQGNLGAGLATIGVSAVAVGAVLGKVSWGLALTVLVGVVVMFGATDVLVQTHVIDAGVC